MRDCDIIVPTESESLFCGSDEKLCDYQDSFFPCFFFWVTFLPLAAGSFCDTSG